MKVYYVVLIILVSVLFSCQKEQRQALPGEVIITGKVENPQAGGIIVLERLDDNGTQVIDSTSIDGSEFQFFVKEESQSFYRINIFDRQIVTFILSGDDKQIDVTADGGKATGDFTIRGSVVNDQKNRIDSIFASYNEIFRTIDEDASEARENQELVEFERLRTRFFLENDRKNRAMKKAIWDATPNLSAIYGLNYLDAESEFQFLDSLATSFKESGKLLSYTETIVSRVESMRKLAIGSPAPEISLPSPDGKVIKLSSLKGKYVLIDFWAAWCRPCRQENPNVKRVYAAYADKGFEILGVSLDRQKNDWVKAIEKDDLPWLHVSDLQYYNSAAARLYEINAIPATYLVDPEGKIVAKGLRGPTLKAKLQEIFG